MTEDNINDLVDKFCNNVEGILKARKYYEALKQIEEIAYTTDFDICDIQKICKEVLKWYLLNLCGINLKYGG